MDCEIKRELAKTGMAATLGLTLATALHMKGINKKIHIIAGSVFVGFALWHHTMYDKKSTTKDTVPTE
jgi:hypothetical protein